MKDDVRLSVLLLLPALLLPACTATDTGGDAAASSSDTSAPARSGPPAAELQRAAAPPSVVPGATASELAVGTSAALYESAPVVVLAGEADAAARTRGESLAVSLGVPLLLSPSAGAAAAVTREVDRLAPETVLAVGSAAKKWADELEEADVVAAPASDAAVAEALPEVGPTAPATGTVVLATGDPAEAAAVATAGAAGAEVVVVPGSDPRADPAVVTRMKELAPQRVLGLGGAFGPDARFAYRVAAASTGVQLPGGGQLVLPGKRYVALYGHPGSDALGVLGEQGPEATVARAAKLAESYAVVRPDDEVVIPTFEIITTVASSAAGADGDYSNESTLDQLRGHIDAAAASGTYVLLDLQPGYTDFLTQAKLYEEFLLLPHVGLALDPEWRLAPGQRHMVQIGTVGADEVNRVGDYLATLVRDNALPQKMLLLHQFKTFMLEERERIVADRDELSVVTQMDGHGPTGTKLETWSVILQDPPAGMRFGWKNFYDEDSPTMTPARTLAVEPTPVFISYQ